MGTNYYWHDNQCGHCGRYERIHVGKSRVHWRGYPHQLTNPDHPDWGYDEKSPFGFPVLSLADWRKVFTERPGQILTEYGTSIDDPLAWLEGARPPNQEWRDEMNRYFREGENWYDAEGFYFAAYEFC